MTKKETKTVKKATFTINESKLYANIPDSQPRPNREFFRIDGNLIELPIGTPVVSSIELASYLKNSGMIKDYAIIEVIEEAE